MSVLRMLIEQALREGAGGKLRAAFADVVDAIRPEQVDPPPLAPLVIFFALKEEAVGVLDRLENAATFTTPIGEPDEEGFRPTIRETHGKFAGRAVTVVETGVGSVAADRAATWAANRGDVQWFVSAGFAGALDEQLSPGDFLLAKSVLRSGAEPQPTDLAIDAPTKRVHLGTLLSCEHLVRTADERRRLAAGSGALGCDLETHALFAAIRRAPLNVNPIDGGVLTPRCYSVRIISDGMQDELPVEIDVLARQENWAGRLGAAAGALFRKPGIAKDLLKFQNESLKLADRLARFLEQMVPQLNSNDPTATN